MNNRFKYNSALKFALLHYNGLTRSDKKTPYIIHPLRIATLLRYYGFNEFEHQDIHIAALLHDLIEDNSEISFRDIQKEFGTRIAAIVQDLSLPDDMEKNAWLKSFGNKNKEVKLLKMIDRIDNICELDKTTWTSKRKIKYIEQAKIIYDQCKDAHSEVASDLRKIIQKTIPSNKP